MPSNRPTDTLRIVKHVLRRIGVEIDPLKIAKIDRIGRTAPHAAKDVGIGHLEPQARPSAGTMPGDEASRRIGDRAELPIDLRNHLRDERLAARTVGGAVGIDVMPPVALPVEHHADEFFFSGVGSGRLRGELQRLAIAAAERRHHVDRRIAPVGLIEVTSRQHDRRVLQYFAMVKLRQQIALDDDLLDPFDVGKCVLFDDLIQCETDCRSRRRR